MVFFFADTEPHQVHRIRTTTSCGEDFYRFETGDQAEGENHDLTYVLQGSLFEGLQLAAGGQSYVDRDGY